MSEKTSTNLFRVGKSFLYVFIAFVGFVILLAIFLEIESSSNTDQKIESVVAMYLFLFSPLIILVPSLFLVKRHSIAVGGILLGIGLLFLVWMLLNPIESSFLGLYLLFCPADLLFLLVGGLFLSSGLLHKKDPVGI